MSLNDTQRKAIHDLALNARTALMQDAREHLEGTYGLQSDGTLESAARLPQVQDDPESAETYRRLHSFLIDETRAGLARPEAVEKLVKEIAFTHLNRLVAFKMLEARKLIKGTIDKGTASNAYKIYLVEVEQRTTSDYAAYRRFLLWQAGQIAQELAVLFDPDTLASRMFPRERALTVLLDALNHEDLAECWHAEETVGWVYQFFNESEKADVFAALKNKKKIRRQDIPAATQLFTPNWIVRFLVQNTLGRTWVQMHPDTRLLNSDLLNYLVPLKGDVPAEALRPVREITLLDPACGTMHFGLVAFDLFAAMYQEELERAGEDGWLDEPSVTDAHEIAAAIVANNIYGIDIDLRAVQLSALALYLKAKALNKNAKITDSHLASADVLPLNGTRLGTFLREMRFSPLTERLIKTLWERLKDANQFGSLLRLEREIKALFAEAQKQPLIARMEAGFGQDTSWGEDFWDILAVQIVQGLDEFARQQAQQGVDMRLFRGEAVKGLRLLDVMLRRYDVVVANPPYSGKRNLNDTLASFLDSQYPDSKGDLYTAFIERCAELLEPIGRMGLLTIHSFMFLSSYETMRKSLTDNMTIEVINHMGTRTFMDLSNPNAQGFVGFTIQAAAPTPETQVNAIRLSNAAAGDGKREGLEQALATGREIYHIAQRRFDAIPGAPWAYWVSDKVRDLFVKLPKLGDVAQPRQGLTTADNRRFIRFWWELGVTKIGMNYTSRQEAERTSFRWFPLVKGGRSLRWFGGETEIVNWKNDGKEIKEHIIYSYPYLNGNWQWVAKNPETYFKEGAAYSAISGGNLYFRWMIPGFICEHASNAIFVESTDWNAKRLVTFFNSSIAHYMVGLNQTININVDDLLKVPLPLEVNTVLDKNTEQCIYTRIHQDATEEILSCFIAPLAWQTGLEDAQRAQTRLAELEAEIDEQVYKLYGIEGEDRRLIEAELAGGALLESDDAEDSPAQTDAEEEAESESPVTREELAVRWISYAIGIILGRFKVGAAGALGSAIYRREAFAVGSLPAPDEDEFNQLVGNPERFAYIDNNGGRHLFSVQVEQALNALCVPDGITILDENHAQDLATLVQKALDLMLGTDSADAVIREGAAGDLRKFLSKDFFTAWHNNKWYRKRPIYWCLQSAKRSYGFVLFHERFSKYTLYTLLREYGDYYLARLKNQISDLESARANLSGKALKTQESAISKAREVVDEVSAFAKAMERIANEGYQPESNWIDDGIILRLAPLWELMPIWKAEPKKYWERLAAGDFDWSHIAMSYWDERVREKCKTNKSFAIAHSHEEWFQSNT